MFEEQNFFFVVENNASHTDQKLILKHPHKQQLQTFRKMKSFPDFG
jgi:hypothetical protein